MSGTNRHRAFPVRSSRCVPTGGIAERHGLSQPRPIRPAGGSRSSAVPVAFLPAFYVQNVFFFFFGPPPRRCLFCLSSPCPRPPPGVAHTSRSAYAHALPRSHGRARACRRTPFPSASGAPLAYTPGRVWLAAAAAAVFSARPKPTLSRGSRFSRRLIRIGRHPRARRYRSHVRARRTRRVAQTSRSTTVVSLLFTYRFICIYVLLSYYIHIMSYFNQLCSITINHRSSAHRHADYYFMYCAPTQYTINIFVLPELFVIA